MAPKRCLCTRRWQTGAAHVRCTTRTTAPSSCEAAAHVRWTIFDVRFANNAQQSCGRRVDSADALPRKDKESPHDSLPLRGKSYAFVQSHSEPSGAFTALLNHQWFELFADLPFFIHGKRMRNGLNESREDFIGTDVFLMRLPTSVPRKSDLNTQLSARNAA